MNQNNDPSKIIFEGEESRGSTSFQATTPKIIQRVIKYSGGYVRDEKQAMCVLLGFVIFAIVFIFFLIFSAGGDNAEFKAPTGHKIIYPQDGPPRLQKI